MPVPEKRHWFLKKSLYFQGVEKVDTLSSKAHFIQAFDE